MSEIPQTVFISFSRNTTVEEPLEFLTIRLGDGINVLHRRTCDILSSSPERNEQTGEVTDPGQLTGEAIGDLRLAHTRDPRTLPLVTQGLHAYLETARVSQRHRDILETVIVAASRVLNPTPYDRTVRVY